MQKITQKSLPWGLVIVVTILFFPLGFFLIYKNLSSSIPSVFSAYKSLLVFGGILGVFALTMLIDPSQDGSIEAFVMLGLPAIALIIAGLRMRPKMMRYRRYYSIVGSRQSIFLDVIASETGASYSVVRAEIGDMLTSNFFPDAYIDDDSRTLVRPNPLYAPPQGLPVATPGPVHTASAKTKAIVCGGCGAKNVVVEGRIAECEYCGSPLSFS